MWPESLSLAQADPQPRCARPAALLLVGLMAACGDPSSADGDAPQPEWLSTVRDADAPLPQRIASALEGIQLDPCAHDPDSPCAMKSFGLGLEHVDPDLDPEERILIIDELVPSIDMLRNRHRILGVFAVDPDAQIESLHAQWELPKTFGDIVTAFASFPSYSAGELEALRAPLADAFAARVPTVGSHGLAVHWILTDRVPDRGVLFLGYDNLSFHRALPEVVCQIGPGHDGVNLSRLRQHAEDAAQSLLRLVEAYRVSVINASWGFTLESVRGPWESVCGAPPPPRENLLEILDAYTPIFEAMFGTPGLFTTHAALQSARLDDGPFDIDDPRFTRRLRVGSFGTLDTRIPFGGGAEPPTGSRPQPRNLDYADVFVNSGCDETACRTQNGLSMSGPLGFGTQPFPLTQSSFVSPVLTAEFVRTRQSPPFAGTVWSDALMASIMEKLEGTCGEGPCYRDPLLHTLAP